MKSRPRLFGSIVRRALARCMPPAAVTFFGERRFHDSDSGTRSFARVEAPRAPAGGARDNHRMHLVIPYASALSDAAVQALGTLSLPNLERLLARWAMVEDASTVDAPDADEYALSLPHERLLARLRGWPVQDGLLPFAADAARRDGFAPDGSRGWGLLTPAHWHVGHDQVNLVDPSVLELEEPEARTLHATLAPLFEELGWTWHWAGPTRWYVSHPSLADLPTASIDRVIGRNVDLWLNDHPGVMLVRRLQSEVQMLLYVHPLNDAREARGAMSVNSFWLSGTGPTQPADKTLPPDVVVDDRLRAPLLADDWSAWAEAWHALDAGPLRQLADAPATSTARLSLAGERGVRTWQPAARPWWKRLLGSRSTHALPLLGAL